MSALAVTISHFDQKSFNSTWRQQLLPVSALKSEERVTFVIFNEDFFPSVITHAPEFFLVSVNLLLLQAVILVTVLQNS